MPFTDQADADSVAVAAVRTDGPGPPRRGWLGAGAPPGAPRGRVAGFVWFLSRHGRYGRALMLHEQVRERCGGWGSVWAARGRGTAAGRPGGVVTAAGSFDADAVRRRTVWAAVRWASLTRRLAGGRPGREAAVGAVAAPLAAPVLVLAAAVLGALIVIGLALRALSAVGGSVRGSLRGALASAGARDDPAAGPARRSFDWTPS